MDYKAERISDYLSNRAELINRALSEAISFDNAPKELTNSMQYSLFAGGKRIRTILAIAVYESFGKPTEEILPVAINIELLHTYSLIHDDLPAMDNDDYRRGKLTNHKVFGEAMAILAGDGLLTHAFGNMAKSLREFPGISLNSALQIFEEFAKYSGASGMVGGQVVDLQADQGSTSFDDLLYIHTHKTGDLIVFSVRLGAILAGATNQQLERLTEFGRKIGFAFQIQDDILDVVGDSVKLGKKIGSDENNNKVTYPYFKGIEASRLEVQELTFAAKNAIRDIGINTEILYALADFLIYREA